MTKMNEELTICELLIQTLKIWMVCAQQCDSQVDVMLDMMDDDVPTKKFFSEAESQKEVAELVDALLFFLQLSLEQQRKQ